MMPPSTREVMNSVGSKYAVVVGISKKAREMSARKEMEEKEGRLADMVNHTLENLVEKKLIIQHAAPAEKWNDAWASREEFPDEEDTAVENSVREEDETDENSEEPEEDNV